MHKEQTLEMGGTQAVPGASVAVAMTFHRPDVFHSWMRHLA